MRAWCSSHRFALVLVTTIVSLAYIALTLYSARAARTIGVGYAAVVVTVLLMLRLSDD